MERGQAFLERGGHAHGAALGVGEGADDLGGDEHAVHAEFFKQHMLTKGKELAEACVAIIGQLAAVA